MLLIDYLPLIALWAMFFAGLMTMGVILYKKLVAKTKKFKFDLDSVLRLLFLFFCFTGLWIEVFLILFVLSSVII